MDHDKKLAFVANMTDRALSHVASTPNTMTPKGGMSHDKMLSFVNAMTKQGLEHLSGGGGVGWLAQQNGTYNDFNPSNAQTTAGTDSGQLATAYTHAGNALGKQSNLAKTLTPGTQQGAGNQATLADMYLNQAQGNGPNPAQAQLNQNTGANIAQQAALMAGQRGAGGNAGNLAEQSARQGAATQQQAVGQAATMGAQQQLAAEQNLQNLSASQVGQGQQAIQGLNNAAQNEQNILQGANTAYNNAQVGMQSNLNNVNAAIAAGNQTNNANLIGGLTATGAAGASWAKGGMIPEKEEYKNQEMPWHKIHKMADGGITGQQTTAPQSFVGNWLSSTVDTAGPTVAPSANIETEALAQQQQKKSSKDKKPEEKSQVSSGEMDSAMADSQATGASDLSEVGGASDLGATMFADAGGVVGKFGPLLALLAKGGLLKDGGKVKPHDPSEEAQVSGDSLKNDKIPTMLSSGEIVIPRHITMGPNAPARAAQFVAQQLAKRGKK